MLNKFLLSLLLASVLAGVGAFFYGKRIGKELAESKQKTVIINATNYREQIEHENQSLKRDDIIERLDDGQWLRND